MSARDLMSQLGSLVARFTFLRYPPCKVRPGKARSLHCGKDRRCQLLFSRRSMANLIISVACFIDVAVFFRRQATIPK